jgi:hypothetical protein
MDTTTRAYWKAERAKHYYKMREAVSLIFRANHSWFTLFQVVRTVRGSGVAADACLPYAQLVTLVETTINHLHRDGKLERALGPGERKGEVPTWRWAQDEAPKLPETLLERPIGTRHFCAVTAVAAVTGWSHEEVTARINRRRRRAADAMVKAVFTGAEIIPDVAATWPCEHRYAKGETLITFLRNVRDDAELWNKRIIVRISGHVLATYLGNVVDTLTAGGRETDIEHVSKRRARVLNYWIIG